MDQANTKTTNNITVAFNRVAIFLEMADAAPLEKLATSYIIFYHTFIMHAIVF